MTSEKDGIILTPNSEYGTSPCGCNPAKTHEGQEAAKNEAGRNADTNGAVRVSPFRNGVDRWMKVRHCGFGHEKVGTGRREQSSPNASQKTYTVVMINGGRDLRGLLRISLPSKPVRTGSAVLLSLRRRACLQVPAAFSFAGRADENQFSSAACRMKVSPYQCFGRSGGGFARNTGGTRKRIHRE